MSHREDTDDVLRLELRNTFDRVSRRLGMSEIEAVRAASEFTQEIQDRRDELEEELQQEMGDEDDEENEDDEPEDCRSVDPHGTTPYEQDRDEMTLP